MGRLVEFEGRRPEEVFYVDPAEIIAIKRADKQGFSTLYLRGFAQIMVVRGEPGEIVKAFRLLAPTVN